MIIDTHVHIGGEKVGFDMSEEKVIAAMEKYKINFMLVSNGDCAEVDHEQQLIPAEFQVSQEDALKRCIAFARNNPGKIGVGVWVKPLTETVTEELERLIAENRDIIYALKLHPFHSKTSPMDEKTLPYLELANKYKLPVVSHTGTGPEDAPIHVYEAAKMFPEIPFVMVHMGLGSDNKEALELLGMVIPPGCQWKLPWRQSGDTEVKRCFSAVTLRLMVWIRIFVIHGASVLCIRTIFMCCRKRFLQKNMRT